jgi:hypothetical protein
MRLAAIAAGVLGAMLLTTTISAQEIGFDFDRTVNFAGFKTYAWVAGTNVPDQLVHQRLVNAVDAQMAMKGMTRVAPGSQPDLLVAYHATTDRNLQITGFGSGWGGYRFYGSRNVSARAEEILVGTWIVDIVNPRTNAIVWRATATKDIDLHAKPEKRDKGIAKAAEKMFKHYPPKA